MRSRKYTKIIEIYQTSRVSDGYGGYTVTDEIIARSWCNIRTVSNNSRYSQRLTDLGITDPTSAIIVSLRHRNDLDYNAINQYLKHNGNKYIIQNAPTDINLEGVDVEIIATKQATESV